MKMPWLVLSAALLLLSGCPTPLHRDGGTGSTTSGGSGSGGTSGGGNTNCPQGSGCTLGNGGAGLCCAAGCLDTSSDPENCGSCGVTCPTGATCSQGYCIASSCAGASSNLSCTLPDSGLGACCAGACLDPNASFNGDPVNCGGCGAACETGSQCLQGLCTLADGGPGNCNVDTDCPSGDVCTFNGCQPTGCSGATAGAVCALPATASDTSGICCNSNCLDSQWDDQNCGGCGITCSSAQDCLYGFCSPHVTCGPSTVGASCLASAGVPGTCCGTTCADTSSDSANCGGCGQACPSGGTCAAGGCLYPDGGGAFCAPPSVGCAAGTLCAFGSSCVPATCTGSSGFCFLGVQSSAGICCGGNCVDPTQDPGNCGGCGVSCGSGLCVYAGNSGLCLPAGTNCVGAGGCPSGESCVGGQCQQTDCTTFETNLCATNGGPGVCCVDFNTGALPCSDPATDANNCGGCGISCPSGQTCAKGLCSGDVAPCGAGHVFDGCNLDAGFIGVCCPGGGCTDPNTDVNNCGFCGSTCPTGQTCVAGNCQ